MRERNRQPETGIDYFHSVRLQTDKCRGCTNCIKRCPMEAIRVRDGKARIMEERCIDCGECIRICPNRAKVAVTDPVEKISSYRHPVALPAPALFGQFKHGMNPEAVVETLLSLGFAGVFEVALAAEVVAYAITRHLKENPLPRPLISSACPAVVRLIQIRFHSLVGHIVPIDSPMEVAAKLAKRDAIKGNPGLRPEDVGAFFITPCPAKMTSVIQPVGVLRSQVDGVISASDVYAKAVKRTEARAADGGRTKPLVKATKAGICWGRSGGESESVAAQEVLAVDGIHSVTGVLEEIEKGSLSGIDFVEAQACIGGCIGGCLMPESPFIARVRLKAAGEARSGGEPWYDENELERLYEEGVTELPVPLGSRPVMALDEDVEIALSKLDRLEKTVKDLPGLDCGACGSPSCRALAEDIVRGLAVETDCTFKLRERVKVLAEEMAELTGRVPPAMGSG